MKHLWVHLLLVAATSSFASGSGEAASEQDSREMADIRTSSGTFRTATRGDRSGEPVILLHGFPETSAMWDTLQEILAQHGYYSVAPDQRGYSPEARPAGRGHYKVDVLAEDVIALADSLGLGSFHIIGHDWGSAVAWYVASRYPDRVRSLTAMSVPHPEAFRTALTSDPLQHDASFYMRLFRWPLLPEMFLKAANFRNLRAIWDHSSQTEVNRYISVFRQRGAVTAAINWYRANYRTLTADDAILDPVTVPTLYIWGNRDPAILRSAAQHNGNYVSGPYTEHFLDAGHWLVQESFAQVCTYVLSHLSQHPD
jgi:pimeloyl-ACP methyl ester carboxylesterase